MLNTLKLLFAEESGAVISAELVLVLTIAVLAMVVGLDAVGNALSAELEDIAEAFGAINQSFEFSGLAAICAGQTKAVVGGSSFNDTADAEFCDCVSLTVLPGLAGHVEVTPKCE